MESIEIWFPIPGYNNKYYASNIGRIKSFSQRNRWGKILNPKPNKEGYIRVKISLNGKMAGRLVHCLIALTFLPNHNNYPVVNHRNGIKTDNRIENLEWCTVQHNNKHASQTGLNPPNLGIKTGRTQLSDKIVMDIFNSTMKQADISKLFGVSIICISKIKTGRTWSHLTKKQLIRKFIRTL